MEYFLIETDEMNPIPYLINKNWGLDTRMLTKEKIDQISRWSMMEMNFPEEGFFPDLLCDPCIMVSKTVMEVIRMYHPNVPYKGVKLWDKKTGVNATYCIPILDMVDCISEETIYNNIGNRIEKLVLDQEKIKPYAVFKVKGYKSRCIVGRMDFLESVLKRGARGMKVEAVGKTDIISMI